MTTKPLQVEVVKPVESIGGALFSRIFFNVFGLAVRSLVVWWAIAAWVPEYGITYWQIILPVYAARMIFTQITFHPRVVKQTT